MEENGEFSAVSSSEITQIDSNKSSKINVTGRCKQIFQCEQCSYSTKRKDSFRNHLDTHDPDDSKKYVCDLCSKAFRSRGRHRRHLRSHHNPEQLLKCCHCDYQSIERATLHQHLAAKHQVDPNGKPLTKDVRCPDCDYMCVAQYQLKNHALRKHGRKPFKCEECGYASVRRSDVDKHIRMKHRNERPYMCHTCGRCSKTKSAFTNHLLIHNGEKSFKCSVCNLAFHHNYQLRAHSKLHLSDYKPFLCHLCSYTCRRNYHLQNHIKKVHGQSEEETNGQKAIDNVFEDVS
ncbi:hypothetical protein CHUAL_001476 [Chamberlinius hualienensis]